MSFPKTNKRGPIKFHWYEGKIGNDGKENKGVKNLPPIELFHGETPKNSAFFLLVLKVFYILQTITGLIGWSISRANGINVLILNFQKNFFPEMEEGTLG